MLLRKPIKSSVTTDQKQVKMINNQSSAKPNPQDTSLSFRSACGGEKSPGNKIISIPWGFGFAELTFLTSLRLISK
jgi:hypothetical protein